MTYGYRSSSGADFTTFFIPSPTDLAASRVHIPVVALTAWISALWQEKAERVGITTYLIKPVSPEMVKDTIEKYTRGSLRQML